MVESTKGETASFKKNAKSKKSAGWIEPLMRRLAYSLHILRHDAPSHVCTIALSKLSVRRNTGAPMPLANFPSSKQLASALSRVGVRAAVLEKIKRRLDAEGLHTLTDLRLSEGQVATLGFKLIT